MNKTKIVFLLLVVTVFLGCQSKPSYSNQPESIARGNELFEQHCTACHNFKSAGIGSNLSGITKMVSYNWLNNFIKNPKQLIDSGDERAVKLYKKYNIYMPNFEHLKTEELNNILAFLNTKTDIPKSVKNNYGTPLKNPIKDSIAKNGKTLVLKYIMQVPATSKNKPVARINKMHSTPDGKNTFINDLNGILYHINGNTVSTVLKIEDYFKNFISTPGLGTGFGSFAFHPDFKANGLLYTSHTEKNNVSKAVDFTYNDSIPKTLQWVVTEWEMNPKNFAIKNTHRELLRIDMPTRIHGMQDITFNPVTTKNSLDYGNLYIGIGDGGSAENGFTHLTQSTSQIWGTILRINPLGNTSKNKKYGIPNNNPFANNKNALGEIWAYGFRNPHRMSWHPNNGQMLASDIGHKKIEEINSIEKGYNYGWPKREGTFAIYTDTNMENVYSIKNRDTTLIDPVLQFDHDEANAICGGFVYNGKAIPELKGKYIFGSIVKGCVFMADAKHLELGKQSTITKFEISVNNKTTTFQELTKHHRIDLRLDIDGSNEPYLYTKADGKIYKIIGVK